MSEDPARPPSAAGAANHNEPEETAQRGPWGGSTFAYRGAVTAVLVMLASCATPPGLGQNDRRLPVDVTTAPWRSLGLVLSEVGGRCTGVLVGPRTVLTAAHCLYHPVTLQPLDALQMHFFLAPAQRGNSGHARAVAVIRAPGFSVSRGMRPDPAAAPNADWAVLVLETEIGDAGRTLSLANGYLRPGTPIVLGGYQADSGQQMVADTSCVITGYGADPGGRVMLRHSCTATRGTSGGPLLTKAPDGKWLVVGVASLATNGAAGGWAVPTAAIAQAMQRSTPSVAPSS